MTRGPSADVVPGVTVPDLFAALVGFLRNLPAPFVLSAPPATAGAGEAGWWAAAAGWAAEYAGVLSAVGIFSAAAFVGGLLALPWLVARIPADYFAAGREPSPPVSRRTGRPRHPAAVWAARAGRNLAGVVLVLAGVAMLVLPGQGVLTILAGLLLTDLPGKRRAGRAIVRRGPVRRALNALRRRRGAPPLRVD